MNFTPLYYLLNVQYNSADTVLLQYCWVIIRNGTVKPVLETTCAIRPPLYKGHNF